MRALYHQIHIASKFPFVPCSSQLAHREPSTSMADNASTSTPSSSAPHILTTRNKTDLAAESNAPDDGTETSATPAAEDYDRQAPEASQPDGGPPPCHIMEKLPKELRLIIYEFAFQAMLDDVSSLQLSLHPDKKIARRAASNQHAKLSLALLHTSHDFRKESSEICATLARAHEVSLNAESSKKRAQIGDEVPINVPVFQEALISTMRVADAKRTTLLILRAGANLCDAQIAELEEVVDTITMALMRMGTRSEALLKE